MLSVGVFDSGLGGLTIVSAILEHLQGIELHYIADTQYAPYGQKSQAQILEYSLAITEYFVRRHAIGALVIACNTATSAAITALRVHYPHLIIIGTEPGVNPAMQQSRSQKVGVLATPATLDGEKYQHLVAKLSKKYQVQVFEQACPGLVEQIELGELETSKTVALLEEWLAPMRQAGVDTIVLGCTHYVLVSDAIQKVMQREVYLIEVAQAIAQRLSLCLENKGVLKGDNQLTIYATGSIAHRMIHHILKNDDILEIKEMYQIKV